MLQVTVNCGLKMTLTDFALSLLNVLHNCLLGLVSLMSAGSVRHVVNIWEQNQTGHQCCTELFLYIRKSLIKVLKSVFFPPYPWCSKKTLFISFK